LNDSGRETAVQVITISVDLFMLTVGILMTSFPTKPSLALRNILVHFAAKTLQHQLPLSVGHVQSFTQHSAHGYSQAKTAIADNKQ